MSALRRIRSLLDEGKFEEHDPVAGDAVRVGFGTISARPVVVVAHDVVGPGASGRRMIDKLLFAHDAAARRRCPLAALYDGANRPVDTRGLFAARDGVGRIFASQARLMGRVPQVTAVFGPLMSARSFPVALSDAVVMVAGQAFVGLTHPRMVRALTGEDASMESLGGASLHARRSGLADAVVRTEAECLTWMKAYLAFMPQSSGEAPPAAPPRDPRRSGKPLSEMIPGDDAAPFAMRSILAEVLDEGSELELKSSHAPELITSLARIGGLPVGVVANAPDRRGGVLFVESCRKLARFVKLCDSYGVPLVFFLDVPGLMVGARSEEAGIVAAAADVFAVLANATVARIGVVVRKAYSAGLYAMSGPAFDPDAFFALPTARLGVFGGRAARYVDMLNGSPAPSEPALEDLLSEPGTLDAIVPLEELRATLTERLKIAPRRTRSAGAGLLPL